VHTDKTSYTYNSMLQVYNSVSGTAWRYRWPDQLRMRTRPETEMSKRLISKSLNYVSLMKRLW